MSGPAQSAASLIAQQLKIELDALPYIDFEYNDEATKTLVDAIVRDEASRSTFKPEDLLEQIPALKMPEFKVVNSHFWEAECARLSSGRGSSAPMDLTRMRCEAPKTPLDPKTGKPKTDQQLSVLEKQQAVTAWTAAVLNAQTQLQHQTDRLINLELMKKFGGTVWKSYNDHILALQQSIDAMVVKARKDIDAINRKRKTAQVSMASQLQQLETQWFELTARNHEIETACYLLDQHIKKIKTHHPTASSSSSSSSRSSSSSSSSGSSGSSSSSSSSSSSGSGSGTGSSSSGSSAAPGAASSSTPQQNGHS